MTCQNGSATSGGIQFNNKEAGSGSINFSEYLSTQFSGLFNLKYFKELKVGYILEFDGNNTSDYVQGKIALAGEVDGDGTNKLNGYADGLVNTLDMKPDSSSSVTINLYKNKYTNGEKLEGPAVGINVQPMNSSYQWPTSLKSIKITSITFIALPEQTYE